MNGHTETKRTCSDCGRVLPEKPVVVIIEGEVSKFCDRFCAAGNLGGLDPETGCAPFWPEFSQTGGEET